MNDFWLWCIANVWFCIFTVIATILLGLAYLLDHFWPDESKSIKPIFLATSVFPLAVAVQLLISCFWLSGFFFCVGITMFIDYFFFYSKKSVSKNESIPQ